MCGIAGVLTDGDPAIARDAVGRMIRAFRHRGPDGEGETCIALPGGLRHLVLGHARLAILDLSERAAQPMADPATGSWLVYNGELYNFWDLRVELETRGHCFTTRSDTEVLLRAWLEWGEDCFSRLRGMYAFALWDGSRSRLILGRDPLGIKPLLIGRWGETLAFASEFRALQAGRLGSLTLSPAALAAYLTHGAVIEPLTMAQEVLAVPPGCIVVVDPAGSVSPPKPLLPLGGILRDARQELGRTTFRRAQEEIHTALARSVRAHLVSDVPVGVFLSGGIDSSLVAILADEAAVARELTLLTVGFPEEADLSEVAQATRVARGLQARHQIVDLTPGELDGILPRALQAVDQPTVDGINTYVIAETSARLGLKVLLSGLGGDEVFGGYTTFWKTPLLAHHPALLSQMARIRACFPNGNAAQWDKLGGAGKPRLLQDAYLLQRSIRWGSGLSALAPDMGDHDHGGIPPEAWTALTELHAEADFYQIACFEMAFYMRNQLLRDADIFGSANAVEIRVPFLDLDLIRTAWRYPPGYHRRAWGWGKRIPRSLLRSLRPDVPRNRRKRGFVLPWDRWLRDSLAGRMAATLHRHDLYRDLGLDPQQGETTLRAFQSGDPLVSWAQVWSLFVLLDWQERHRLAPSGSRG